MIGQPTAQPAPVAPDVVCLGESMAMIAPAEPAPLRSAEAFTIRAAGAESNVAMYLCALGHGVAWAGRVGDDPLGQRLLDEFHSAGVGLSLVERDPQAPTGVYFKDPGPAGTGVYYYRGGSAATRMTAEVIGRIAALRPKILHVSGIVPALSDSCAEVIRALVQDRLLGDTVISFDVNFRRALWRREDARDVLQALAQAADIVFVGIDEATELWGSRASTDLRGLLDRPVCLLVKNGAGDAVEYGAHGVTAVHALKVTAVEPIGAGDAFAAGWLSGYLRDLTAVQRLRLGHVLAATAMKSMADFDSVPSPAVLEAALSMADAEWLEWSPAGTLTPGEPDRTASLT
jgi:2-dehydro-3-deoxygluconokinase